MSKDKHPSDMTREELEREVQVSRILCRAYHECIQLEELVALSPAASIRLRAAVDKARAL